MQASEHCVRNTMNIGDMPSTLGIYKPIIVVCEFRDVSYEDFQDSFPQRNIDFHINLVLSAQPISKTPIK